MQHLAEAGVLGPVHAGDGSPERDAQVVLESFPVGEVLMVHQDLVAGIVAKHGPVIHVADLGIGTVGEQAAVLHMVDRALLAQLFDQRIGIGIVPARCALGREGIKGGVAEILQPGQFKGIAHHGISADPAVARRCVRYLTL